MNYLPIELLKAKFVSYPDTKYQLSAKDMKFH